MTDRTGKETVHGSREQARGEGRKEKPGRKPREIGGPAGPEPTRYGDWEKNGRCSDF